MTSDFGSTDEVALRSRRGSRLLLDNAGVHSRRGRRRLLFALGLVACIIAWHAYPYWRMYRLRPAIAQLRSYRETHGRFPGSMGEVEALHGIDALYLSDKTGAWFELRFAHLCFYDLGDLRHFQYDSWDDDWSSHAD